MTPVQQALPIDTTRPDQCASANPYGQCVHPPRHEGRCRNHRSTWLRDPRVTP